jgi:hypothetical protein
MDLESLRGYPPFDDLIKPKVIHLTAFSCDRLLYWLHPIASKI